MDSEFVKRFMNQLGQDDNLFIVALDGVGTVTYANARARETFCDSTGKLIGAKWVDLAILPEDRLRAKKRFAALLAGKLDGLAQIGDVDVLACDGSRLRILWSNHLLRESDGTIAGFLDLGRILPNSGGFSSVWGCTSRLRGLLARANRIVKRSSAFCV